MKEQIMDDPGFDFDTGLDDLQEAPDTRKQPTADPDSMYINSMQSINRVDSLQDIDILQPPPGTSKPL
jgi:hypothetical protein